MTFDILNMPTIMSLAAIVTALGGAWLTVRRIARDAEKHRKAQAAEFLQSAKEADALVKTRLEGRIHELESQLSNLKENVEKDLKHLKETSDNEFKTLGEKIENLRDELRHQSADILSLLTKMIDKH